MYCVYVGTFTFQNANDIFANIFGSNDFARVFEQFGDFGGVEGMFGSSFGGIPGGFTFVNAGGTAPRQGMGGMPFNIGGMHTQAGAHGHGKPRQPPTIVRNLNLSLQELYHGTTKKLRIKRKVLSCNTHMPHMLHYALCLTSLCAMTETESRPSNDA